MGSERERRVDERERGEDGSQASDIDNWGGGGAIKKSRKIEGVGFMEVIGGDNESSLEHADFELDQVEVLVFSWEEITGL